MGVTHACMNNAPRRTVVPVRMKASLIFIFGAVPPAPIGEGE
jgi:hypothetical protein